MYGQFGTDGQIAKYFDDDFVGTAIEVGAAHGTVSSNTLWFEEKGWKCLCIEPNPYLYRLLARNRPYTQNYAVGKKNNDNVDFHIVTLSNGDQSAISGLKLDQKLLDTHPVKRIEQIKVDQRTLDFCIEEFGLFTSPIDMISIDTEGTELKVLEGFDIEKWKPQLMVIENNHNDSSIERYLKKFGYEKKERYFINDFYCPI